MQDKHYGYVMYTFDHYFTTSTTCTGIRLDDSTGSSGTSTISTRKFYP